MSKLREMSDKPVRTSMRNKVCSSDGKGGSMAMSAWAALEDGIAGFLVGFLVSTIPAAWWPQWLRGIVGKRE
jgi:hypothetical protein